MEPRFIRYRRFGHRTVKGWVVPPTFDVVRLLSEAQVARGVKGALAEIGVHHGRLFIGMQLVSPGARSVAIDLFGEQLENVDGSGAGNRRRFEANVRRWGDWATVVVKQGNSSSLTGEEVRRLAEGPVRLFSVDGGHTEEIVAKDMQTAQESLVSGGVVIADDIFNPEWPSVSVGTLRYLDRGGDLRPFAIAFNKVFFTDAANADYYRERLFEAFESRLLTERKLSTYHGVEVVVLWRASITVRRILRHSRVVRTLHEMLTTRPRSR